MTAEDQVALVVVIIIVAAHVVFIVGIFTGLRWAADEVVGTNQLPETWAACMAKARARKAYRDELARQKGKP